jgi:hypothetical protein
MCQLRDGEPDVACILTDGIVKDIMAEILWKSSQVKERTINSFFN